MTRPGQPRAGDGPVRLTMHAGVATVTVDAPPVNALGRAAIEGLQNAFARLGGSAAAHAVVLTGAGTRAFVAGADIGEFAALCGDPAALAARAAWTRSVFAQIEDLAVPVIAAVQASALGGGLEVALLCDFIIADPSAKLGCPEVSLGLIPGAGGTQRLPRRVGLPRAMDMIMTGKLYDAQACCRFGLVDRVSEPGKALEAATELAAELAAKPALAIRSAKLALRASAGGSPGGGLDVERNLLEGLFASADFEARLDAFVSRHARPSP